MKARVLAIVPAFNEVKNLPVVVAELKTEPSLTQILVVNDASSDETERVAKELGVEVLSLPFNLGIGGAVQTGLKFALEMGFDVAVQFDGDGQHVASEIPVLLGPLIDGKADIVVGSRYIENRGYRTPAFRRMGMVFSAWMTSAIIGKKLTDITSGFRAWNRQAILLHSHEYPMSFAGVESSITAHYAGLEIVEVSAHFRARVSGRSSINFWRSLYYPFKTMVAALGVILRKSDQVQRRPNQRIR